MITAFFSFSQSKKFNYIFIDNIHVLYIYFLIPDYFELTQEKNQQNFVIKMANIIFTTGQEGEASEEGSSSIGANVNLQSLQSRYNLDPKDRELLAKFVEEYESLKAQMKPPQPSKPVVITVEEHEKMEEMENVTKQLDRQKEECLRAIDASIHELIKLINHRKQILIEQVKQIEHQKTTYCKDQIDQIQALQTNIQK
ncbi:hypothetical protein RFI_01078, partial [Reticulomyxa filosa]